jgi:hypothetical protein
MILEHFFFHLTILLQVRWLWNLERIFRDEQEMTWTEVLIEYWATIPEFSRTDEIYQDIRAEVRADILLCWI